MAEIELLWKDKKYLKLGTCLDQSESADPSVWQAYFKGKWRVGEICWSFEQAAHGPLGFKGQASVQVTKVAGSGIQAKR